MASQLAERGGGVAKFLTSSPEEKDISTALDEVLADWAEPMMAGLRLGINRQNVQAAGREALLPYEDGWSLIDLGDLPAGRTIWVAGRVPRGKISDLVFRVMTAENQEVATRRLDLAKEASQCNAIKALFGGASIAFIKSISDSLQFLLMPFPETEPLALAKRI